MGVNDYIVLKLDYKPEPSEVFPEHPGYKITLIVGYEAPYYVTLRKKDG